MLENLIRKTINLKTGISKDTRFYLKYVQLKWGSDQMIICD